MITVVIMVVVLIILGSVFIANSTDSIGMATETKYLQEITEVKKGVNTKRLSNSKKGLDEETLNQGFIKVRVEDPPEIFESFDEDEITGYVVDLHVIEYEKSTFGQAYLDYSEDDIVTFNKDDVYIYDALGTVFYAKGFVSASGDSVYADETDIVRKDGPTIEVISTSGGHVELKVTPYYDGDITSVTVGNKKANSTDGRTFTIDVPDNGTYIVIATEEGGNSTRTTITVADMEVIIPDDPVINDVYIENEVAYTREKVVNLMIDATSASHMYITINELKVPSVNGLVGWREYASSSAVSLKEGVNKIYVWCKNSVNKLSDYKMVEVVVDTVAPTKDAPTYVMTGYLLEVTAEQTDSSPVTFEYGYKDTVEFTYTWQESNIIEDVAPGKKMDIITRATDAAGNVSESRATTTEAFPAIPSDITIVEDTSDWSTSKVVTITYPETYGVYPYTNYYRIDDGEWQKAHSDIENIRVINNCKIEAVVAAEFTNSKQRLGDIAIHDVTKVDRNTPEILNTMSEEDGTIHSTGYDVTLTVQDFESGLSAWTITSENIEPVTWDNLLSGTNDVVDIVFRVERNGHYYIWAKDEVGLISNLVIVIENIDLTDPIINSYEVDFGVGEATLKAGIQDASLGLVAYAWTSGENVTPTDSDWISINKTMEQTEVTLKVTENDTYTIWAKDISGRVTRSSKYVKVKFMVTYDFTTNGGTSLTGDNVSTTNNTIYVGCNTPIDLTPVAKRPKSTFLGWSTNPNDTKGADEIKVGTVEDVIIYAIFSQEIKLSFYYYEGETKMKKEVMAYLYNNDDTVTVDIPEITAVYTGWDSRGWTLRTEHDADVEFELVGDTIEASDHTDIYMLYEKDITVSYRYFKSSSIVEILPIYTNAFDVTKTTIAKFTAPDIEDTVKKEEKDNGWDFRGWSLEATANTEIDLADKASFETVEDTTYYASYVSEVMALKNMYGKATTENVSGLAYMAWNGNVINAKIQLTTPEDVTYKNATWEPRGWSIQEVATGLINVENEGYAEIYLNTNFYAIYGRDVQITTKYYNDQTNTIEAEGLLNATGNIFKASMNLPKLNNITLSGVEWLPRGYSFDTTAQATIDYKENEEINVDEDVTLYASYYRNVNIVKHNFYTTDTITQTAYATYKGQMDMVSVNIESADPIYYNGVTWEPNYWTATGDVDAAKIANLNATIETIKDEAYYMLYGRDVTITRYMYGAQTDKVEGKALLDVNRNIANVEYVLGTFEDVTVDGVLWNSKEWCDILNFNDEAAKIYSKVETLSSYKDEDYYALYGDIINVRVHTLQTNGTPDYTELAGTRVMTVDGTKTTITTLTLPELSNVTKNELTWKPIGYLAEEDGYTIDDKDGKISKVSGATILPTDDTKYFAIYETEVTISKMIYQDVELEKERITINSKAEIGGVTIKLGTIANATAEERVWQGLGWDEYLGNYVTPMYNAESEIYIISNRTFYAAYSRDVVLELQEFEEFGIPSSSYYDGKAYMNSEGATTAATLLVGEPRKETVEIEGEEWAFKGWSNSNELGTEISNAIGSNVVTLDDYTLFARYNRTITLTLHVFQNASRTVTGAAEANTLGIRAESEIDLGDIDPVTYNTSNWIGRGWSTEPEANAGSSFVNAADKIAKVSMDDHYYASYVTDIDVEFIGYSGEVLTTKTKTGTLYMDYLGNIISTEIITPSQDVYTGEGGGWIADGYSLETTPEVTEVNKVLSTVTTDKKLTFYGLYYRTIKISYDPNNGVMEETTTEGIQKTNAYDVSIKADPMLTINAPIPVRNGYTFMKKWTETKDVATPGYSVGDTLVISEDTTLYALWEPAVYTINYDLAGGVSGDGTFDPIQKEYGEVVTLSSDVPIRENYMFMGWATSLDSAMPIYQPGDQYKEDASVTLYAVWQQRIFALMYSDNTMGFNTTGVPGPGKTLADESYVWQLENEYAGIADVPWYDVAIKNSMTSANFEERIAPLWTAAWFYGFENLQRINNIENLDTSRIITMANMFEGCSSLEKVELRGFNTANVLSMSGMFKDCTTLTYLDISSFDISSLNSAQNMFYNCSNIRTIFAAEGFSMRNISNGQSMFRDCVLLVGGAGTAYTHAKTGKEMAYVDGTYEGYFTGTNMRVYALAYNDGSIGFNKDGTPAAGKTLRTDGDAVWVVPYAFENEEQVPWNSKVTNFYSVIFEEEITPVATSYWFNGMRNLTAINNIENLNTEYARTMEAMFKDCINLASVDVSGFRTNSVTNISKMFAGNTAATVIDLRNFNTSNVTDMSELFSGNTRMTMAYTKSFDTSKVTNMSGMFKNCKEMTSFDLRNFNTSNVTDMSSMFENCSKITYLDLYDFNTAKVTNTEAMFKNCSLLTTIYATTNFVTTNITASTDMFTGSTNIIGGMGTEYSNIATDKVYARIDQGVTMSGYFTKDKIYAVLCSDNTLEINTTGTPSRGKTLYADNSYWAIASRFTNATVRPWNNYASSITSVSIDDRIMPISTAYWFAGFSNITAVKNLSNLDTSICKYTNNMFDGCSSLASLATNGMNMSSVLNTSYMFRNCAKLTELDFSSWNTNRVTTNTGMFAGCVRLVKVDVGADCTIQNALPAPSDTYIDSANGKWYNSLGQGFASKDIPVGVLDTYYGSIKMVPATLAPRNTWFKGTLTSPSDIVNIVITNEYTSSGQEKETWFADESNVGAITCYVNDNILYIVNNNYAYDSGAIMFSEDITGVFADFTSLRGITGLKLFSTIRTQYMDQMFGRNGVGCSQLKTINGYADWNVSNVISVDDMFSGAGITDIDLTSLNFEKLTDYQYMFRKSNATTITLGDANLENTDYMFADCPQLQLINISEASTENWTSATSTFANSSKLITIYVGEDITSGYIINSSNMFKGCTSILGGDGTVYDANFVDRRYAKIDNENNPGYFTLYEVGVGVLRAKLYESGTVATSFVELTEEGVDAPAWSYKKGAKLLEIKASNLMAGEEKTVTVKVPVGMYIEKDTWTKVGEFSGITYVAFETLDIDPSTSGIQQGTSTYYNPQTGTITFTVGKYAAYTKIQMLVMYDQTIWDKCIDNGNLTKEPAVVVTLNDSQTIKVNNVKAGIKFGDGGINLYTNSNISKLYVGDQYQQKMLTSFFYLSSDQMSYNGYYKNVMVRTSLYGTNAAGDRIYATYRKAEGQSGADKTTVTTADGVTTFKVSDVYATGHLYLPLTYYTLPNDAGFIDGSTVYYKVEVVTEDYVGKIRTDVKTISYVIGASALNYNNFSVVAGGGTAPVESYHEGKEYYDYLGLLSLKYNGVADAENVGIKMEFDIDTAAGTAPKIKVNSVRPPLKVGLTPVAKVTLVNDAGQVDGPYNVTLSSGGDSSGAYIHAPTIASNNGLTGNYYIKSVEYTMTKVAGSLTETLFYSGGGSSGSTSGGTFYGWASSSARSRITVTFPDGTAAKTSTITTGVTSTPSFAGEISSYGLPNGSSVTAGGDIVVDFRGGASYYPYTNTLHMKKPTYFFVLPEGVNVKSAVFSTSQGGASIAESEITKGKTVTIDGVVHYVYTITTKDQLHYGGYTSSSTGRGNDATRWVRITLSTDRSMEMTTLVIRDLISMKNGEFHSRVSGSQQAYNKYDPYDVDNDGSTSDSYATINSATASIKIYPVEE